MPPLVLQKLLSESLGELDAAVKAAGKNLQAVDADFDLRRVLPSIRNSLFLNYCIFVSTSKKADGTGYRDEKMELTSSKMPFGN